MNITITNPQAAACMSALKAGQSPALVREVAEKLWAMSDYDSDLAYVAQVAGAIERGVRVDI